MPSLIVPLPPCHSHRILPRINVGPDAAPLPSLAADLPPGVATEAAHSVVPRQYPWPTSSPAQAGHASLARALWRACQSLDHEELYRTACTLRLQRLQHASLSGEIRRDLLADGVLVGAVFGARVGVHAGEVMAALVVHLHQFLYGNAKALCRQLYVGVPSARAWLQQRSDLCSDAQRTSNFPMMVAWHVQRVACSSSLTFLDSAAALGTQAARSGRSLQGHAAAFGRRSMTNGRFESAALRARAATATSREMCANAVSSVATACRWGATCGLLGAAVTLGAALAVVNASIRAAALLLSAGTFSFYSALASGGLAHQLERDRLAHANAMAHYRAFSLLDQRLHQIEMEQDRSLPNSLRGDIRLFAQSLRAEISGDYDAWIASYKQMLAANYSIFECGCTPAASWMPLPEPALAPAAREATTAAGIGCTAARCEHNVTAFEASERWDHLFRGQPLPSAWQGASSLCAPHASQQRDHAVRAMAQRPWLRWAFQLDVPARETSAALLTEASDQKKIDSLGWQLTALCNLRVEPAVSAARQAGLDAGSNGAELANANAHPEVAPLPYREIEFAVEQAKKESGELVLSTTPRLF